MGAPTPRPGWYPDPSGNGGQSYWDGYQWTAQLPPHHQISTRAKWIISGLAVGGIALLMIGTAVTEKNKPATLTSPLTPSATATSTSAPGTVPPQGVTFSTAAGPKGDIVTAQFQITDAFLSMFTRTLAQATTKEILRYAHHQWPDAAAVNVIGMFPTNDGYGNTSNSAVVNVTYLKDVMDRINFDGYIDDIWAIRSSGSIHPQLQ
jgi:hypothetical protein